MKMASVQKYLTLTRHVFSPALIMLSPKVFNGLAAADKQAFRTAAQAAGQAMRAFVDDVEKKGVEELRAQGMLVVTKVDTARFQAALAPGYAEYARKYGQASIDRIRNYK